MTMQITIKKREQTASVAVDKSFSPALVADWLEYNQAKSPATIKTYNAALKNFFAWLNDNQIAIPNRNDVNKYSEVLCKTKSLRTARLYVTAVKVFARWLSSLGGNRLDFAAGVAAPDLAEENETHAREALELEDAKAVLKSFAGKNDIKSIRDALIIRLMMNCGLRSIEIVRLDATDVHTVQGRHFLRVWGKGRKGKTAKVAISKTIYNQIQDYLNARGSKRIKGEAMFVSTSNRNHGKRLQTQTVSRLAKRTLVDCGFDSSEYTCHSFRHTCASLLLDNTRDIFSVQKLLRHRNPKTTQLYISDKSAKENVSVQILSDLLDS